MSYEGNTHKINDLLVNVKGDTLAGGCFGNVTKDLYVKDLKLVRPDITSETSAGALVGFGINIPDRYGDPVKPLNISVEMFLYSIRRSRRQGRRMLPVTQK